MAFSVPYLPPYHYSHPSYYYDARAPMPGSYPLGSGYGAVPFHPPTAPAPRAWLSTHDHQVLAYLTDFELDLKSLSKEYDAAIVQLEGGKPKDDVYMIPWSDYVCGIKMERENVQELFRLVISLAARIKAAEVSSTYAIHCAHQYGNYLENFKYERWSSLTMRVHTAVEYYRNNGTGQTEVVAGESPRRPPGVDPFPTKAQSKPEKSPPPKTEGSSRSKPEEKSQSKRDTVSQCESDRTSPSNPEELSSARSSSDGRESSARHRRRLTKTTRFSTASVGPRLS